MIINDAAAIYLGETEIIKVYLGVNEVWAKEELPSSPELIVNGTFNTDGSGWTLRNGATLDVIDGVATLTKTTGSNPFIFQTVNLVGGKTYEIRGTITEAANPTAAIRIGTSAANLNITHSGARGASTWTTTYTPASDILIYYSVVHSSGEIGSFIKIDNLSVKEVV